MLRPGLPAMNETPGPAHTGAADAASDRLDSWKEIAAYLRRDESTVRRWEKDGLPVRRHRHKVRASVFAYKSEVDAWWNSGRAVAEPRPPGPEPRRVTFASAAVTGLVAGAFVLALAVSKILTTTPVNSSGAPVRVMPFTSYSGGFRTPAFSPDGDKLAFSWTGPTDRNWDIYVKAIGGGAPRRLTSDPGDDGPPAWSPDGQQIAFLRSKDKHVAVYVTSVLGGSERKLLDVGTGRYFNLQWTRDGKSLLFAEKMSRALAYDSLASYAIFLLSLETLEKRQVTFPRHPESDHRFAVSPDGTTLAFLRHGYQSAVGVFTMPIGGGAPTLLHTEPAWAGHVVWSADGRSLIFTSTREGGNKVWRLSAAGGEPQHVSIAEEWAFSPSVASKGDRAAYVREYFDTDLMRVELSGMGNAGATPLPVAASARLETAPAFSPDGKKLAFFSEQSGRRELWISSADGGSPQQFTDFHAWDTTAPSWSPDGKHVLFFLARAGDIQPGLIMIEVETKQRRTLPTDAPYAMPQWSRDGRWIFATSGTLDDSQVLRIPAKGGVATPLTAKGALLPRESPDGQFLYYLKQAGGIWRIPVRGGPEALVLADFPWSLFNNWYPMNDGIYYVKQHNPFKATVEFHDFATRRERRIVDLQGEPLSFQGGLAVSPDGQWLVYSQVSRSASDIMMVENFR
jgi:Tol biopolymer transport system component